MRLAPESRAAFEAMVGIYRGVLERIEASGYRIHGQRIRLTTLEKISVLLRCYMRSRTYQPPPHNPARADARETDREVETP